MALTKEKFKELWDAPEDNISMQDVAECAVAWGLYTKPKSHPLNEVLAAVMEYAGCTFDNIEEEEEDV
jgi:hypothetical protein